MPRHFQSKHPWNQQPPSFVFIILLTAFYTAFNKHSLPAFHLGSQQTEGWKTDGGGEEWSLEETSKLEKSLQMGMEKEHLGFLSPGPKEKTKVMLWRKKSPLPSPEESGAGVVCLVSTSIPEGVKQGLLSQYSAHPLLVLFRE